MKYYYSENIQHIAQRISQAKKNFPPNYGYLNFYHRGNGKITVSVDEPPRAQAFHHIKINKLGTDLVNALNLILEKL